MVKEAKKSMKGRGRADSVLESKLDGTQDLKRLKSSQCRKWQKMKQVIAKDTTKLCLIQVPKNVRIILSDDKNLFYVQYKLDSSMNALDLGYEMRKLSKKGRQSHNYKLEGAESGKKDTVMTLEIREDQQKSNEFTG